MKRFKNCRLLMLGVAVLILGGQRHARATDYVWNGAVSSDWNTASNWTPNGVPAAADAAIVGTGLSVSTAVPVTVGSLTLAAGSSLQGAGQVVINSAATFTDAKLTGSGLLNIKPGAMLDLNSVGTKNGLVTNLLGFLTSTVLNLLFDKPIVNQGTIRWNAGNLQLGADLQNDGIFDVRYDGVMAQNTLLPVNFTNSGTFVKSSGGGVVWSPALQNSGTLRLAGGNLDLRGGYSQDAGLTQFNGGSLKSASTVLLHGGKWGGTGTLIGNLRNDGGSVAPGFSPGSVVINGNYTQTSGGTLEMELGGMKAGTEYDQMVVNGTVTLGGALKIMPYGNFVPAAGSRFQLVKYVSCSGNFSSVENSFAATGRYFTTPITPSYLIAQTYVDTTKPSVAITAPVANAVKSSFASVTGTAGDSGGLARVTVQLYRYAAGATAAGYWNGQSWDGTYDAARHERLAVGTTSWSLTLPALAAGQYQVRATAIDKANNATTSANVNFWIDATAPSSVSFVTPTAGAKVAGLDTVTVSASDDSLGSGIASVTLRLKKSDGTFWTGSSWSTSATNLAMTLSGGLWTRTNSGSSPMPGGGDLPSGVYILSATAVDRAGLTKSASINVTVSATTAKSTMLNLFPFSEAPSE